MAVCFIDLLLRCSGRPAEVSLVLTSGGVGKVQHRLTGSNNNKSTTSTGSAVGQASTGGLGTVLSPSVIPSTAGPLLSSHQQHGISNASSSMDTSPSILKDDLSDSYVIQVWRAFLMKLSTIIYIQYVNTHESVRLLLLGKTSGNKKNKRDERQCCGIIRT